jgi:outer membrane receptor for ferrienterochelin and colicins
MSKFISFIALAVLFSTYTIAQTKVIKGQVFTDKAAKAGVFIKIKELSKGTVSGPLGEFKLTGIPEGNYSLEVSYVGFITQEIKVTVRTEDLDLGNIKLQEDFLELEQVVITATRSEVRRKDAPIVCNILTDKILKATQSITLSEGLSFQPALRIENNCQNCGFNGLRMNGLESAYSQVLIDGRPIFNSLQGVYGLEQIPANMIERVEIVRSGGSALYGSSAVAGTVNVITKEPKNNSFYLNSNQSLIDGQASDRTFMAGTDIVNENKTTGLH